MKNEPAFEVGEEVYYVSLDNDDIFIFDGRIEEVYKYCSEITRYDIMGAPRVKGSISEKKIFKKDKKSFVEKLNLIFAEEVDNVKNKEE